MIWLQTVWAHRLCSCEREWVSLQKLKTLADAQLGENWWAVKGLTLQKLKSLAEVELDENWLAVKGLTRWITEMQYRNRKSGFHCSWCQSDAVTFWRILFLSLSLSLHEGLKGSTQWDSRDGESLLMASAHTVHVPCTTTQQSNQILCSCPLCVNAVTLLGGGAAAGSVCATDGTSGWFHGVCWLYSSFVKKACACLSWQNWAMKLTRS